MLRTEILAELREILQDEVEPYGWSDTRLMRLLALGQNQFCRDTGFFADATTFTITTVENQKDYPLDGRIIEIYDVWDGLRKLKHYTQGQVPQIRSNFQLQPLMPISWQTDKQANTFSLYDPPTGGVVLTLRAWRRPLGAFNHKTAAGKFDAEMEIPEDFQFAPIHWAASKALLDHDRELQDPVKSAVHVVEYKKIVHEGEMDFIRRSNGFAAVEPNPHYVV